MLVGMPAPVSAMPLGQPLGAISSEYIMEKQEGSGTVEDREGVFLDQEMVVQGQSRPQTWSGIPASAATKSF